MKLSVVITTLFALVVECSLAQASAVYYQGTVSNIEAGWNGEGYAFQLNGPSSVIQGGSCTGAIGTNWYAISASQTLFYPLLKQLFLAYSQGKSITVVVDNTQCGFANRGFVISVFNP